MRFILYCFIVVSFVSGLSPAQINPGAKDIALSNSSSPVSDDVFSLFNNPAGLSETINRQLGFYYSPAPFGFTEMANGFAVYSEPFNWGAISAGAMTYGFKLYKETKISLGGSYKYSENFFIGGTVNYHNVSIERYGSASAFYMNAGSILYLNQWLRTGFYIQNINNASFKKYKDQIPVLFNLGAGVDFDDASISVAAEKDVRYKLSFSAGLAYYLTENFTLRGGIGNEPKRFSGGFGIKFSFFDLDYAVLSHYELGLTHQFSLILSIPKNM